MDIKGMLNEIRVMLSGNPEMHKEDLNVIFTRFIEVLEKVEEEIYTLKMDISDIDGTISTAISDAKEEIADEIKDAICGASITINL